MSGLIISGETYERAVEEALQRAGLPLEALQVEEVGGLGEPIDDRHTETPTEVTLRVTVKPEFVADTARGHLLKMLRIMGIHAEIRSQVAPDIVKLNIRAPESALLIGRNGQTLEAFQHMVNRMSTRAGVDAPYVTLDIEDYRERRLARLERIARRGARQALESKEEVELEDMSPADRKIVHMTLRSMPAVKTFSRGDEGARHVVIAPSEDAR